MILDEWQAGVASLNPMAPPRPFHADRWRTIVSDCRRFLASDLASEAAQLGWSTLDLFGVNPAAPDGRWDAMGLMLFVAGGEIAGITERSATIAGQRTTFYRHPRPPAVPLWEFAKRGEEQTPKAVVRP